MSFVQSPANIHPCCGTYWAGQTCRRCGRHFEGGGAISFTMPANGLNLQNAGRVAPGTPKRKTSKKGGRRANKCLNCGALLPPAVGIAASLICDQCQAEMMDAAAPERKPLETKEDGR